MILAVVENLPVGRPAVTYRRTLATNQGTACCLKHLLCFLCLFVAHFFRVAAAFLAERERDAAERRFAALRA